MAVIRASKLWLTEIPPSSVDGFDNPEENAVRTEVYTCPPGKKTIVRTATFILTSVTAAGQEPVVLLVHQPAGSTGWYYTYWFWFIEHLPNLANWRLMGQFSGQIVLNAGDKLAVENRSTVYMHTAGHGHVLPVTV